MILFRIRMRIIGYYFILVDKIKKLFKKEEEKQISNREVIKRKIIVNIISPDNNQNIDIGSDIINHITEFVKNISNELNYDYDNTMSTRIFIDNNCYIDGGKSGRWYIRKKIKTEENNFYITKKQEEKNE